jgi:hypothetical protein
MIIASSGKDGIVFIWQVDPTAFEGCQWNTVG